MASLWIVLVVVSLLGLAWWLFGSSSRRRRPKSAAALRKTILRMTHDPGVAERLIERERERHPALGERALLAKVIRRLERDRRR
ncbi:MAG TPA: hypothetical protein RMH99_31525 [Sandaracinaceae bacterium LLY-WYZ-13_1]|nr:hypothetical protein [Sandaracinaceae bacterium LLY-WYZ-13_1]